uniref:Uncharacterized protein n=1 Tax=Anguilla anguilla TaxID=7936 RepID=A0A0E9T8W4_ANGAN
MDSPFLHKPLSHCPFSTGV